MVRFALFVGVLSFLFSPSLVSGQEPAPDPVRVWVAAGLGGGLFASVDGQENDPGIAVLGALVLGKARHRVALRGSVVGEVLGDAVAELGLLYGRTWTHEQSETSVSAGAALVFSEDCHGLFGGPCEDATTVGLPLSATVSWRPSRFLGLGLEAFANVNTLSSFVGLAAVLELGSVR